jgi:lysophospholipase L1-like esterase
MPVSRCALCWMFVLAVASAAGCGSAGQDRQGEPMLVFIGDSITAQGDWKELTGQASALNFGVPGDKTDDILSRLDAAVRTNALRYFVMAGVNDLSWGIPADAIVANMEQILARLRSASPNADIVLQSVLPLNTSELEFAFSNAVIRSLNEDYAELATRAGARFVDLTADVSDADGELRGSYTYDGLHLGPAGYEAWAAALRRLGLIP